MSDGRSMMKRFIRMLKAFVKWIFHTIYFSATSIVPMHVFVFVFNLKNSFWYAIAIAGISLIIMDIICSILEDIAYAIYKLNMKINKRKQRKKRESEAKKQTDINRLENLIKQKNDFSSEIRKNYRDCTEFKSDVKSCNELPEDIKKELVNLCERTEKILEVLKQETKEYYSVRHTFSVIFPKFQKWTLTFISLAKADSLEEETMNGFRKLMAEYSNQLDYVKGMINSTEKFNLSIGVESLVKTMQAERKKGDT